MSKALGADINAVDVVKDSGLCPDLPPELPEDVVTAEADVNFLVTDVNGTELLNRDKTITCVAGIDQDVKFIVTFGPENCGVGGGNVGAFKIFTSVTGEAGDKTRTHRIRCRP